MARWRDSGAILTPSRARNMFRKLSATSGRSKTARGAWSPCCLLNLSPGESSSSSSTIACFGSTASQQKNGISDTLSPRAIVVGAAVDYENHCKIEFGTYVQTHEQHDNAMIPRTIGAIALRPSGNSQGGHYFFSLTTGKRLLRNQWTTLPMPADVIERLHKTSRWSPDLPTLEFANRAGVPIEDDDDDDSDYDDDDARGG